MCVCVCVCGLALRSLARLAPLAFLASWAESAARVHATTGHGLLSSGATLPSEARLLRAQAAWKAETEAMCDAPWDWCEVLTNPPKKLQRALTRSFDS